MKSVDIIGRSNCELKQFQHSAEAEFQRHAERIEANIPRVQHEAALVEMREMIEKKMNAQYKVLDDRIKKLSDKTQEKTDMLEKMIKEIESNTYWKVKDIEKLLEIRPTLEAVKDTVGKECINTLV